MPIIYKEDYGVRTRSDGKQGWVNVVPTKQAFVESDGTDVRLDRVYVLDSFGHIEHTYLQDKMGARFGDNQPGTEDDLEYLLSLPSRD